jgi:hypothetical protein
VLIKYYRKIGDMDIGDPLKHPMLGALLWMVLHSQIWNEFRLEISTSGMG